MARGTDNNGGIPAPRAAQEGDTVELGGVEWEVISTYSRAQALADGVLCEMPSKLTREAGFNVPVALTAAVHQIVTPTAAEEAEAGQSYTGRAWDILNLARMALNQHRAAMRAGTESEFTSPFRCIFYFDASRLQHGELVRDEDMEQHRIVDLVIKLHPGDQFEPVVTISLPGED